MEFRHQLYISGKEIMVYPSAAVGRPVIYLNTVEEECDQIYQVLQDTGCPDFNLVTVSGLDWHHDMTPWEMPPLSHGAPPCTGGADEYLQILTKEILPEAEAVIQGPAVWRGIAGYSLAGLFAIYSAYQTSVFSRIASMSGSLWFPKFKEYVFSHEMKSSPEHIYLSLGDRECRTGNPYLRTVQEHTGEIAGYYARKGIDIRYCLNPGNHFKNAVRRTAAGIAWILER